MKARYLSKILLPAILVVPSLLFFQNCSSGFDTNVTTQSDVLGSDGGPDQILNCSLQDGTLLEPGDSEIGYPSMSAVAPFLCGTQVERTCLDTGVFDGDMPLYQTCSQYCRHPESDQPVNSGFEYVYYTSSTGDSQAACDAARVSVQCQQASGQFSGSIPQQRFASCLVQGQTCAYTSSSGTAIPSGNMVGASVSGFAAATATYPNLCGNSVTRSCGSSGWSGTVPLYTSCAQKCVHPDSGQPVDSGASYVFYTRASGTAAQCLAARQSSTCNAATGLFQQPSVPEVRYSTCQEVPDVPPPPPPPPTGGDEYQPDNGPVVGSSNRVVSVSTSAQLLQAMAAANPGDAIQLNAGTYRLTDSKVRANRAGTATNPIFLRATSLGTATIEFCNVEGFYVSASNWVFENLVIRGACLDGSNNEHAFHMVGGSSNTILRNSKVVNFMSAVKTNCDVSGGNFTCPSGIKFINNRFFNDRPIPGNSPFNVLNIDGANNVVVRGNLFYDFASSNTSRSATAIYPKMHSNNVLVEQNFVVCEKNVVTGSNRRAMNVGDATDGNPNCINSVCRSYNGVFRNNIFMNCQGSGNSFGIGVINQDTSVYLNNTVLNVKHNWYDSLAASFSNLFRHNLFAQAWNSQTSGLVPRLEQNVTLSRPTGTDLFVDATRGNFNLVDSTVPASLRVSLDSRSEFDYCGNRRGASTTVGAIDFNHSRLADCLDRIRQQYGRMILD